MEIKLVFSHDFNHQDVTSVLGRDDSGFEVDPRQDLHSITDPSMLAALTIGGTVFSALQLACALWELHQNARRESSAPAALTVDIELPGGIIVSVPAHDRELAQQVLVELLEADRLPPGHVD